MAFDIIDWQDGVIMGRDLKILDQARTIERLSREIAILRGSVKTNWTEPTQDTNFCDPDTCKHPKENKDKSRRLGYYQICAQHIHLKTICQHNKPIDLAKEYLKILSAVF